MLTTTLLALFTLACGLLAGHGWRDFGQRPPKEAFAASANWRRGRFRNTNPLRNYMFRAMVDSLRAPRDREPRQPVPVFNNDGTTYRTHPAGGLRLTWLGHSTLLLEIAGKRLLVDPLWGPRASPFSWMGPKRWYENPLALADLPEIDAVLVSHDHYDHLCRYTVDALKPTGCRFIVPLGVGSHLRYWGVAADNIVELDWWQAHALGDVTITATPARHASGRHLFDMDQTLWAGFAVTSPDHRLFYSGDSGLFDGFREIGDRLGPFDITMIESGAYSRNWPDWHMGPEQAVIAHEWLRGRQLLPLHWGLFNLSLHNWTEPMDRVLAAASERNVHVLTPQPGQPFSPGDALTRWWPDVAFRPAASAPVMSKQVDTLTDGDRKLILGQGDPEDDTGTPALQDTLADNRETTT